MDARARIEAVLRGHGLSDQPAEYDSDIHSWRCRYPDRYGPCTCFEELLRDLEAALRQFNNGPTGVREPLPMPTRIDSKEPVPTQTIDELERSGAIRKGQMADPDHYKKMREAGSVHPCEVEGCRLSQEEHHRLSYGLIAENRELRRRLAREG